MSSEKENIDIIPFGVMLGEELRHDGIDVTPQDLYDYADKTKELPKTSAINEVEYEEFFAEQLTKAQHIIHITMAKNVSMGYDNAREAAKTFENINVVDSGHLSCGMGLLVLHAAEYAASGMSSGDIIKKLERIRNQIKTSFVVNSTEYLAKSGRISPKINTICKTLLLHPILVMRNSSMVVGQIRMGTRDVTWKKYTRSTIRSMHNSDRNMLFIVYTGLQKEELKSIEEEVLKKIPFKTVIYQKASSAISINCGPGSFGFMYMLKD